MENYLKEKLKELSNLENEWTNWDYSEDINEDALTNAWLDNQTSFIYKVGVLCAIDSNKCDWMHIAIGTKRSENSNIELKGIFHFDKGENDDMGRVIERAFKLMRNAHPSLDFG